MPPFIALLIQVPAALAAEVTEIAPKLRGDLGLSYDTLVQRDRLEEDGTEVGQRVLASSQLTLEGSFSFTHGAALFFAVPRFSDSIRFPEGSEMAFDPNTDSGTMIGTDPLDAAVSVEGKGLGGTWIGLRGAPFHEDLFASRGDRSSWLLEAGYRFADKTPLWTITEGQRGAGPGSSALRLRGAFSTTHRSAQPYITTSLLRSRTQTIDVYDASGLAISAAEITPASEAAMSAGVELFVFQHEESGSHVSLDFRTSFAYQSWQTLPSGLYIPSILSASRSVLVTQSERTTADLGLGINSRIKEYAQLNVGGTIGTSSPQQIEHLYAVSTAPGTLRWGMHVEARFRARDPLVAQLLE